MRKEDAPETGLDPQQQLFLMGQVAALQQALSVVAMGLSRDARQSVRQACLELRDDPEAMATVPKAYRATHQSAWFHTFDRLASALSDRPDNEG